MTIIDFRVRPPARGFLGMIMYTAPERRNHYTRQLGLEPAPSAEARSMDMLIAEMDAAGIGTGVVQARVSDYFGSVSNDEAKEVFGSWESPKPYIRIVPQP